MKAKIWNSSIIIASSFVLTACGGGGDGDSSDTSNDANLGPAITLSSENYSTAAAEALGSVNGIADIGDLAGSVLTGAETQGQLSIAEFIQRNLPAAIAHLKQNGQQLTGVVHTETIPCDTGSIILQLDDVSGNEQADAGDTITITSSNCVQDGTSINGMLNMTFTNVIGDPETLPFSLAMKVTPNNFSTTYGGMTYGVTGSLDIAMTASSNYNGSIEITSNGTHQMTGGGTNITYKMNNYRVRTEVSGTQMKLSVNGNINIPSLGANTVTVQTNTPFTQSVNAGAPTSGQATLRATNGGQIRVTANNTLNALIEFDANMDGTYETSKSEAWSNVF